MEQDNNPKALFIVLPNHNSEWEDIQLFLTREEAQKELDQLNRKSNTDTWRIEVFKIQNKNGYTPVYETIYK